MVTKLAYQNYVPVTRTRPAFMYIVYMLDNVVNNMYLML